jgi:hypothetical protein
MSSQAPSIPDGHRQGSLFQIKPVDILEVCRQSAINESAQVLQARCLVAADEIARLRAALLACEHETRSLRVWGGMGWSYHPPQAGRIAEICFNAKEVAPCPT